MINNIILNVLFPRRCPVCGEIVSRPGGLICPDCLKRLSPVKSPVCKRCGKEVATEQTEYCPDCLRHKRTFDGGMALLHYNEAARRSMAAIKYQNRREYLDFYAAAVKTRFGQKIARLGIDVLVPVPVHKSRRRERGFNQAEELARRLEKYLGIPVGTDLLKRTRKTAPQKELTPSERFKNLANAFVAAPMPEGIRTVLLIDDIYTTGSTAEACTRVLKAAGAKKVYVLVLCIAGGN